MEQGKYNSQNKDFISFINKIEKIEKNKLLTIGKKFKNDNKFKNLFKKN